MDNFNISRSQCLINMELQAFVSKKEHVHIGLDLKVN